MKPVLIRAANLAQSGYLEYYLSRSNINARDKRLSKEWLDFIKSRKKNLKPKRNSVLLPVAVWDQNYRVAWALYLYVEKLEDGRIGYWSDRLGKILINKFNYIGDRLFSIISRLVEFPARFFPFTYNVSILSPAGWEINQSVEGDSFTLAFAMALFFLEFGIIPPKGTWYLGGIEKDGTLHEIGRIREKIEAGLREKLPINFLYIVSDSNIDHGIENIFLDSNNRNVKIKILKNIDLKNFLKKTLSIEKVQDIKLFSLMFSSSERYVEKLIIDFERKRDLDSLVRIKHDFEGGSFGVRTEFLLNRALGSTYNRHGDIEDSISYFMKALSLAPVAVQNERIDPLDISNLSNNLLVLFTDLHKWDESIRCYKKGKNILSGLRGYQKRISRAKLKSSLGQMYLLKGDTEIAEKIFREVLPILDEGQNYNNLAASLIVKYHQQKLTNSVGLDDDLLGEALELLSASRRWNPYDNPSSRLLNIYFCDYWDARLLWEKEDSVGYKFYEDIFPKNEENAPLFPTALTQCWRALIVIRNGDKKNGTEFLKEGCQKLFSSRLLLDRLLAIGMIARGIWIGADIYNLISVFTSGKRLCDPKISFLKLINQFFTEISKLTPAFAEEKIFTENLLSNSFNLAENAWFAFLLKLSEKIMY